MMYFLQVDSDPSHIDTVQEADRIRGFAVCGGAPDFCTRFTEAYQHLHELRPLSSLMLQGRQFSGQSTAQYALNFPSKLS
jgi:hypothetical protein